MLFIKLLKYLRGYVTLTATGGFPERFINLCKRCGIELSELRCSSGEITAKTDLVSYKKIRYAAKNSGMRVRILGKKGLPFILKRNSHRIGVPIGVAVCIVLTVILAGRIWRVEVTGNSAVSQAEIISVFEKLGVRKGVASDSVDIGRTEIEAMRHLPEMAWLNVNISGSTAVIEVRESVERPETDAPDPAPSNLVASRDGQIVTLRPFSGTREQKVGNSVLKGDLLISGITVNKDQSVSFCKAEGYVTARTVHNIETQAKSKVNGKIIADERKTGIIHFLVFDIPLGRASGGFRQRFSLNINSVELPVGFTFIRKESLRKTETALSKDRAVLLAELEFSAACSEEFRGIEIERVILRNDNGAVKGEFTCLENIGEEKLMEIEEISG